jgi:hypothetical protein
VYSIVKLLDNFPTLLLEHGVRQVALECLFIMASPDHVYEKDDSGVAIDHPRLTRSGLRDKLASMNISITYDDLVGLLENSRMPAYAILKQLKRSLGDEFDKTLTPILRQMIFSASFAESIESILDQYPQMQTVALDALVDARLEIQQMQYNERFGSALSLPKHFPDGRQPNTAFSFKSYAVDPLQDRLPLILPSDDVGWRKLDTGSVFVTRCVANCKG